MKKTPWYYYVILGLALAAFAYFLYFKPKTAEIVKVRTDREKLEREVKDLQIKKQQLDKIQKEIASLTATLKELETIIPQKKDIDTILRQINQIASDCRLDITKFIPQNEINREFYAEKSIPIQITGSYHNLGVFFSRLNAIPRLFIVDKFAIKPLQNQKEDLTISSDFTTKTFLFLDESATPPASQKKTGQKPIIQQKPGAKRTVGS